MNQKPERTFRIGSVIASVFENERKDGKTFLTVTLQRKYTQDETVKYGSNFALADLPNAIWVLESACCYVESREA